jgi:hypothetical protein
MFNNQEVGAQAKMGNLSKNTTKAFETVFWRTRNRWVWQW